MEVLELKGRTNVQKGACVWGGGGGGGGGKTRFLQNPFPPSFLSLYQLFIYSFNNSF